MLDEQKRDFTGVWIPKEIIEDTSLSALQMVLYGEIASFDVCFVSNAYYARRYGVSEVTISKNISVLIEKGYLVKTGFDGRRRYLQARHIYAMTKQTQEKVKPSLKENLKADYKKTLSIDNNIDNNIEKWESNDSISAKTMRSNIWDALIIEFGYTKADITKNIRGQLNNAVKQLFEIGATPEEIHRRSRIYRQLFPESTFTAMALVNRWGDLKPTKPVMIDNTSNLHVNESTAEIWEILDNGDVTFKTQNSF